MSLPRLTRGPGVRPKVGIVHLGPGAFFRAFGAIYTAQAMQAAGGDWGITAVSLRSAGMRDKLTPQGCAYTSVSMTPDGAEHEVIGVIEDILVAPENPGAVLAALVAPQTKIVSLTITEKGYCHQPSTGGLDRDHPDVAHDLAQPNAPRSAIGYLVHALAIRRAAGQVPFTVLCCDNLPENGAMVRQVVLEFAAILDAELAGWIASECRFPATMVDRITPATTPADVDAVAKATGRMDAAPVMHEPFRQWVIEDNFVEGVRPKWEAAGAQLVQDVTPFEMMKLRCLNGTHSTLAYLGYLAGYETIADTVADPAFAKLIDHMWRHEITPTLDPPEGEDLAAYCAALKARYLNPAIRHRTWQIAMDGSQKLPQRVLGTIQDNLDAGRAITGLAHAVAGWMRYVGGVDEAGGAIDVRDPLADALRAAYDAAPDPQGKVAALLDQRAVFGPKLAADPQFRAAVTAAFTRLAGQGVWATVKGLF